MSIINICLMLLFVSVQTQTTAPDTLTPALLQEHTLYFDLAEDHFEGAPGLEKEIEEAAFVALGELHNSRMMSRFTETLLRFARPLGYGNFAVETGPWSAEKLEQLIAYGPGTVSAFYDEYSSKLFDIYPVPFFTGKADLDFLSAAHSLGYDLWGVDQEFYYGLSYLIDDLAILGEELLDEQQEADRSKILSRLWWWNRRSKLFSSFDMSCRLQEDEAMRSYLDSFEGVPGPAAVITEAIRRSLEIYCLAESGRWSESNRMRIDYFKENFDRYYRSARQSGGDSLPRVILKMGSYHAGRDKSPLDIHDIGHHLQEKARAEGEGRSSLHLRFLHRWVDGDDKLGDPNYSLSVHFMQVARRDEWALIDLRPLRQRMASGDLQGNDFEEREIRNYDYLIVMPEDYRVEKHY